MDLIGTFCIVNLNLCKLQGTLNFYLIGTFCIVNIGVDSGKDTIFSI